MLDNSNVNGYNVCVTDFIILFIGRFYYAIVLGIGGHCFIDFADCKI